LEALIAEFHFERNQADRAREESHRAAYLARNVPSPHLQALALLAVGLSRIQGTPEEQQFSERFLRAARVMLGRDRRWELDALAEDLEARLLETRGDYARAREHRERSIPTLQRAKLPALEIYQQLGIAELLLNREASRRVNEALDRARELTELLHLLPPSPVLLRLWLLEGRSLAKGGTLAAARDRWQAIVDEPSADVIPRIRAEAMLRLALLEYAAARPDQGDELRERLASPELKSVLPSDSADWIDRLPELAKASEAGGSALPPDGGSKRGGKAQSRERTRVKAVENRQRAHHREHRNDDPVE
jgi:hypothetical protein